ncbi:MAG TPA: Hsp20/alpha crystallin family protein [Ruminiclostridium sp.]|nr:Hsp20/alpha crystallin family protein [Ruminiclostridium sp.]
MFGMVPYSRRNSNVAKRDDWFGLDRFFEDFFRDPLFERMSALATPIRADIKENEKEYVVEAELPGVNKEDIIIDLDNDVLTLGADIKSETDNENNGYIYKERQTGSYRRSFHVPNIDNEGVQAAYKDGLLTITLPKAEPEKRSRKIQIQ